MTEAIDILFNEKKTKHEIPDEVIEVLKEIIKRNDKMGPRSAYRVSMTRTIEWLEKEMHYSINEGQMRKIAKNQLGRKSWASA